MHAAALTRDNRIITWGCNDAGALGRDTTPQQQPQQQQQQDGDDSDDSDDDCGLNTVEAEPREVDSAHFLAGTKFSRLNCTDSATFVVTTTGTVYGWGQFRVSLSPALSIHLLTPLGERWSHRIPPRHTQGWTTVSSYSNAYS
jgi:regulator of chromosome condensation